MREPLSLRDPKLRTEFDRCWPWLWASLCEYGATHGKEDVWRLIFLQRAFLWPGRDCVILGQILYWPLIRDFNYWLQGGDLAELKTMHDGIEAWAQAQGVDRFTGRGRDGWTRVMNGAWRKGPTTRTKLVDRS